MQQFLDQTSLLVVTAVHEDLHQFAIRIVAFLSLGDTESDWRLESGPLNLSRIYSGSPPRGWGGPLRAAMWTPRSLPDWTAWFVNSGDGRSHLLAKLSQTGSSPEMVSIRSTGVTDEGGVQEFTYRVENSGTYQPTRHLQWLEEEDGYHLVNTGKRMRFEAAHPANPIQNRTALLKFVRDFGIDLESDEFWISNSEAVYLQQHWFGNQGP